MEHFIARQPIFDRSRKVFGYELLFRSGLDNYFDFPDQDKAASKVIADSVLLFGIEELCSGAKAFINVTRSVLIDDYATVLPREATVVEVLENVAPDEEVIEACRRLKEKGFTLALDDFVYRPEFEPLLELVDIIKVDFLLSDEAQRKELAEALIPRGIKLLAEKVETKEDLEQALEMGYEYFQGFFFCKPVIISRKDIPTSKIQYLRILQKINEPEIEFDELADLIQAEVSISYKLLKYTNSAAFGLRRQITSIVQALALLGEKEFKKWVSLVVLTRMADDKPPELVVTSLVRARFCELAAPMLGMGNRQADLFLMGLFSLLDVIMDRPLPELLAELPMAEDVLAALAGVPGRLGAQLELVVALERGNWQVLSALTDGLQLEEAAVADAYSEAIGWAREHGVI